MKRLLATIHGEGDCVLSQGGSTSVGEKCSDSGYNLKVKSTRCVVGLHVECENGREIKEDSKVFA